MPLVSDIVLYTLLGLGGIFALAQYRAYRINKKHPPLGEFVTFQGKKLHYKMRGSGSDLVFIHGSSGNFRDLDQTIAPLVEQNFRVISIDRPGMGNSDILDPNGETLEMQARFIQGALAQIGVKNPIVMGHSLGGAVAMAWAVYLPETLSRLIMLSGVAMPWKNHTTPYYRLHGASYLGRLTSQFVCVFAYDGIIEKNINETFLPNQAPIGYRQDYGIDLILRPRSVVQNARHRRNLVHQINAMAERYDQLTLPVDVITGDQDTMVPPQLHVTGMMDRIKQARKFEFSGIGHMPHHFAAAEIAKIILEPTEGNK